MKRTCYSLSVKDLQDQLRQHGRRHRLYFHYTTLDTLEKMLKFGELWFSPPRDMNDGFEGGRMTNNIFIACFSYGREESVAMWNTYGIPRREAVRLCFDGIRMRQILEGRFGPLRCWAKDKNGNTLEAIPPEKIELFIQDVAYSTDSKSALRYRDDLIKIIDENGCIVKPLSKRMATYVKMGGWRYEKEVRLVLKLEPQHKIPDIARVAMDFNGVIESVRRKRKIAGEFPITLGPWIGSSQKDKLQQRGLCAQLSDFAGYLDNLRTICDKCDVKHKCKCKHKCAR